MPLIKRDINELRYNSIWLLSKEGNPDYYKALLKNAKAFFYGMDRMDLIEELTKIIKTKIENVMGANIQSILLTYKNLPALNSFTRSRNPLYADINIFKHTIESWLDEIEEWVFQQAIILEPEIRFTTPARQFI